MITATEVIYYSTVGKQLSPSVIAPWLSQVLREQRRILGATMYDAMTADMVDYSGVTAWVAGSYLADDLVTHEGVVYVCTDATITRPSPTATGWRLAPKFNEAAYNALWADSLAQYLAASVMLPATATVSVDVSQAGFVQPSGNNFAQASANEKKQVQAAIANFASLCLKNVREYIADNPSNLFEGFNVTTTSPDVTKKSTILMVG